MLLNTCERNIEKLTIGCSSERKRKYMYLQVDVEHVSNAFCNQQGFYFLHELCHFGGIRYVLRCLYSEDVSVYNKCAGVYSWNYVQSLLLIIVSCIKFSAAQTNLGTT